MRSAGNFHPEWGYLAPAPGFMRTARIALVATAIGATAGAVVVVSLAARPGSEDDNASIAAHALVTSAPVITSPVARAAAPPTAEAPAALAQAPLAPKAEPVAKAKPVERTQSPAPSASAAAAPLAPQVTPAPVSLHTPAPTTSPSPGAIASSSSSQRGADAPIAPAVHMNAIASSENPPAALEAGPAAARPEGAIAAEEAPEKKITNRRHHPTTYATARRWQSANNARKRWRDDRGFGPLMRLFSFRLGASSSTN